MNTLSKRLATVGVFLFLLVGLVPQVSAQGLLFGQRHAYTTVFRGNGEAIVYAKVVLTNSGTQPMTEFSFELPKVKPTEVSIYQMQLPRECGQYDAQASVQTCLWYRDADYTQEYYYSYYGGRNGEAQYHAVQHHVSGNQYQLTLPIPVEPNKSTALIIAYATKGYVQERFGLYHFTFETLKVSSRIQEIRVAVDVDSDLVLKGKRASVDYGEGVQLASSAGVQAGVSNRNLDRIVSDIGSYGPMVKEAKNLAPYESFIVKGSYAKNWFRLYLGSIVTTVLVIAVILAGLYLLSKFLKRRHQSVDLVGGAKGRVAPAAVVSNQPSNITLGGIGLLSAALVVGLTHLLLFLEGSSLFYSLYDSPATELLAFIALILLYILIIFGPAILIATKQGWKFFLWMLVVEFAWFVVFLIIYLALFQSIPQGGGYYGGGTSPFDGMMAL